MPTGLILTLGLSSEPLVFSIKKLKPSKVFFIGTSASICSSLDQIVESAKLKPSQMDRIEIPEDPTLMYKLCEAIQEAYSKLRNNGMSTIFIDPTGGRKWMSAGAIMTASFLELPMFYVDVKYKNNNIVKKYMVLIKMGNAYDQIGFIPAQKGVDYFNYNDFEAASKQFFKIKPLSADKKSFYEGFYELCATLAKWDRFEHYKVSISSFLNKAIEKISLALQTRIDTEGMTTFLNNMQEFKTYIETVEGRNTIDLNFIVDLYLNAKRRIRRNQFDDAVARQYRTLESIAQFLLATNYQIDTAAPDYSLLTEQQRAMFTQPINGHQLPEKIALKHGYWLLNVLGHPIGAITFINGRFTNFIFEKILNKRNLSILAHGFSPITKKEAEQFSERLEGLLSKVFGHDYENIMHKLTIPVLPNMAF